MAYIVATTNALPSSRYSQDVLASLLRRYCEVMRYDFDADLISALFAGTTIKERYFSRPLDSFFDPPPRYEVNDTAVDVAVDLGTRMTTELLEKSGLAAGDVGRLTTMMTTLIAIPTLDARLMERVPFSPYMKRVPLNGLGCMGGAAGVARTADYLKGHPKEAAILISCELGGTTFWLGGLQGFMAHAFERLPDEPGLFPELVAHIISAALFGDGLSGLLMVGREHPLASEDLPKIVDTQSITMPRSVDLMKVILMDVGFTHRLSPDIPKHASDTMKLGLERLLRNNKLGLHDLKHFMIHPGGPKILQVVQEEMGLGDEALRLSRDTLARIGNVSAPTVLYMLNETMTRARPPKGAYGLMASMGPGFSEELVLIQW